MTTSIPFYTSLDSPLRKTAYTITEKKIPLKCQRISRRSHSRQWASNQTRKIADCACVGNVGNVFPRHILQRKPLVSDARAVMHVGIANTRWRGKRPGIPGACATPSLRILKEAHWVFNYGTRKQERIAEYVGVLPQYFVPSLIVCPLPFVRFYQKEASCQTIHGYSSIHIHNRSLRHVPSLGVYSVSGQ